MVALQQRPSRVTAKIAMLLAYMAVIKRNDGGSSTTVEAFAPSIPATVTTATVSSTAAVPSDTALPTILTTDTANESSARSNRPSRYPRATYDLGLGRHGPVYAPQSDSDLWNQYLVASSSSSDHGAIPGGNSIRNDNNVALATQYLVEHATTRNFPVPVPQPLRPKETATSAKAKKSHPPLIPNRITDDADLMIRPTVAATVQPSAHTNAPQVFMPSTVSSSAASTTTTTTTTIPFVMTRSSSHHRSDFDINTAWMELLIYEQQQKHNANQNQAPSVSRAKHAPELSAVAP